MIDSARKQPTCNSVGDCWTSVRATVGMNCGHEVGSLSIERAAGDDGEVSAGLSAADPTTSREMRLSRNRRRRRRRGRIRCVHSLQRCRDSVASATGPRLPFTSPSDQNIAVRSRWLLTSPVAACVAANIEKRLCRRLVLFADEL